MYVVRTSTSSQKKLSEITSQAVDYSPRASSTCCRPSLSVTELPPEIWHRVFDFLFYIPGAFSIDEEEIEAYSEDSEGITLHGLYDDVMSCKLAVSTVSWAWHIATLPYLFNYVKIMNRRHAVLISELFSRFKRDQREDEYYGQWVKRFEICAEDGLWDSEGVDALTHALSLMPNVQVYSDFFSLKISRSSDDIIRKLQEYCEHGRLRRIEWSGAIARDVVPLLRGTPTLRALITREMPQEALHLPELRTLVLRTSKAVQLSDMETLHCPSLQNLVVHSHIVKSDGCSVPTVRSSHPHLTRFRLLRSPGDEPTIFCNDLEHLRVMTLDLGLRKEDPALLTKLQVKHQTLSRLNIVHLPLVLPFLSGSRQATRDPMVSDFFKNLLNADNLPMLKSVGIYIPRSYFSRVYGEEREEGSRNPAYRSFWMSLLKVCAGRGIEVEASVGSEAHFWGIWQPFRICLLPRYLR